jgi:hypothetical protein
VKRRTLHLHGFVVEFFTDPLADPATHHYTVTKVGSSSILGWGQRGTEPECEAEARTAVRQFMKRMRNKNAHKAGTS